jgi:hypothetical protein
MVIMLRWLAAWRRNKKLSVGLPVALALLSAVGMSTLRVDDDIAQLQALPKDILAQEKAITALTGQSVDQKWFVVHGASPQQTLERLEAFTPALAQAQKRRDRPLAHAAAELAGPPEKRSYAAAKRRPAVTNVLKSAGLNAVSPNLTPCRSAWTRGLKARPAKAGVCSG